MCFVTLSPKYVNITGYYTKFSQFNQNVLIFFAVVYTQGLSGYTLLGLLFLYEQLNHKVHLSLLVA